MKKAQPQMCLDFMSAMPFFTGVNSPAAEPQIQKQEMSGVAPELALAEMVVDDRVLRLGKTSWKNLLDTAIGTGHTELYESSPGEFGLRKPGFRFGPIARVPAIAVPYLRERLAARKGPQKARHRGH